MIEWSLQGKENIFQCPIAFPFRWLSRCNINQIDVSSKECFPQECSLSCLSFNSFPLLRGIFLIPSIRSRMKTITNMHRRRPLINDTFMSLWPSAGTARQMAILPNAAQNGWHFGCLSMPYIRWKISVQHLSLSLSLPSRLLCYESISQRCHSTTPTGWEECSAGC